VVLRETRGARSTERAAPGRTASSYSADPRRPARSWIFNLLVGRHDWLILDLLVSPNRVTLRTAQQVHWTAPAPVVIASTEARSGFPAPGGSRKRDRRGGLDAINDLELRWRAESPIADPGESELVTAAFRLARKLFAPSVAGLLLDGRTDGPDIALALAHEDMDSILARMEGRCRPESIIARPRVRLGIHSFQFLRTRPIDP
jgi:hypothetical protein